VHKNALQKKIPLKFFA
jgi:hypothetical protein